MTEDKPLEGLGGWLIAVGLGIIVSPFLIVAQVYPLYSKIFSDGTWAAVTTPGSAAYHPLWKPLIEGEIVVNTAMVLTWICLAFLFFSKKRLFPKLYIGLLVFTVVFQLADSFAVQTILPETPLFSSDDMKDFAHALIWGPYMLVSKRVNATFIR